MEQGDEVGDLQLGIDSEQKLIDLEQVISDVHQIRLDSEQLLVDQAQQALDQAVVASPPVLQDIKLYLTRRQALLSSRQDKNDLHQGQLDDGVRELLQRQTLLDKRQCKLDSDASRRCLAWVTGRDASAGRKSAGAKRRAFARMRSTASTTRPPGGHLQGPQAPLQ